LASGAKLDVGLGGPSCSKLLELVLAELVEVVGNDADKAVVDEGGRVDEVEGGAEVEAEAEVTLPLVNVLGIPESPGIEVRGGLPTVIRSIFLPPALHMFIKSIRRYIEPCASSICGFIKGCRTIHNSLQRPKVLIRITTH
jgi:hypothetical protein